MGVSVSVCIVMFVNMRTLEPFDHHEICMGARYGQKLGHGHCRIRQQSDALRRTV